MLLPTRQRPSSPLASKRLVVKLSRAELRGGVEGQRQETAEGFRQDRTPLVYVMRRGTISPFFLSFGARAVGIERESTSWRGEDCGSAEQAHPTNEVTRESLARASSSRSRPHGVLKRTCAELSHISALVPHTLPQKGRIVFTQHGKPPPTQAQQTCSPSPVKRSPPSAPSTPASPPSSIASPPSPPVAQWISPPCTPPLRH